MLEFGVSTKVHIRFVLKPKKIKQKYRKKHHCPEIMTATSKFILMLHPITQNH